ncbi:receptor expression-enhancing protein 5-like [Centruroides vittatus]|uniref:receptor expression-enhancing protein 5-like n=1 Tax=Centruroides vittatus TaxID=120091 RepID=UPI00350F6EB3
MAELIEMMDVVSDKLHSDNKYTRILKNLEEKTKCDRFYIFSFIAIIVAAYTAVGFGKEFLCTFTSIVYPIYASVSSVEQNNLEETRKLLIYWVIFALIHLFETFFDAVVTLIPYYWMLKMIFLVFCFAPISNNLSVFLRQSFLLKLMKCAILEEEEVRFRQTENIQSQSENETKAQFE